MAARGCLRLLDALRDISSELWIQRFKFSHRLRFRLRLGMESLHGCRTERYTLPMRLRYDAVRIIRDLTDEVRRRLAPRC
jgi:hypothetical protein